jgi:8-oxo-dGTP pyrophosphatase MutT (NUDIX family)
MKISLLQDRFQRELPGEKAHQLMMPLGRPISSLAKKDGHNYRDSAVAVIVYEENSDLQIILTQRSIYEGKHSGQISFPGGKKENFDASLLETAIRESHEEIGLLLNHENYLGKLSDVFIPVSLFNVESHVFSLNERPIFIPDPREVSEIFTISGNELLDGSKIKRREIEIGKDIILKDVPYFHLNDKIIWGATALILSEFRELIK